MDTMNRGWKDFFREAKRLAQRLKAPVNDQTLLDRIERLECALKRKRIAPGQFMAARGYILNLLPIREPRLCRKVQATTGG